MSVLTDLYATLNANAGVRSYVGVSSSPQQSRIYPSGNVPEGAALPHVSYQTVVRIPIDTLTGTNNLHQYTVQISAHARTYAQAQAIAEAVHDALEGNGYMEGWFDFYDDQTKTHSVNLEWRFTA